MPLKTITYFLLIFSTIIYSAQHNLKAGIFQLQSKWGDGPEATTQRGEFFIREDRELSTAFAAPPQTLNIWYMQYEYMSDHLVGFIAKGGYHFNRLDPYSVKSGPITLAIPDEEYPLIQHDGLEDFELTLTYQIHQYKFGLGSGLPLLQTQANREQLEVSRAWDGFRSYRLLGFVETFQLNQWIQFKADIIISPTAESRNQQGDGNIQLLDYFGFPIYKKLGGFAGQIFGYNWYHWQESYTSTESIFRREFIWDWNLGLSYEFPFATIKAFAGITPWASADVRIDGKGKGFESAESSRNITLGLDLNTNW